MKSFLILPFLLLSIALKAQYAAPCAEVPELNQQIVKVLKPYIGKKISRGECWDAAKLALDAVGAKWDGLYEFGRVVNVKTECIQPGDILQFENAVFKTTDATGTMVEQFPHHTAIVSLVKGPGELEIMHQNTGQSGKKMTVSSLNLKDLTKGKVTVYRPVAK